MYEQDYIIKQIRDLVRFIARIFFHREYTSYELAEQGQYGEVDYIYKDIMSLIDQGKINEAENLLFDKMDASDKRYMELALDFYDRINSCDDYYLEKCDFTREEIKDGLLSVAQEFGIPISDILLN